MDIKIALAGNPNSGKTTLFNAITGSNQYVGNWPGVTVEKKEGRLISGGGVVVDLPGIYSLTSYSPEEEAARGYLIDQKPDIILNIIDGTNIERNLYLTTQLLELNIPLIAAVNMADVVRKRGGRLDCACLSKRLSCPVVEISALKGEGIPKLLALLSAPPQKTQGFLRFQGEAERALRLIEDGALQSIPAGSRRFYAIKLLERDHKAIKKLGLSPAQLDFAEEVTAGLERSRSDDAESIIADERYKAVSALLAGCCRRGAPAGGGLYGLLDRILTGRFTALPAFAAIMFLVYYISVTVVGGASSAFIEDGLFGGGFFLFNIGEQQYNDAVQAYEKSRAAVAAFEREAAHRGVNPLFAASLRAKAIYRGGQAAAEEITVGHGDYMLARMAKQPQKADYGMFVPGLSAALEAGLDRVGCAPWLKDLILSGIIGGVGSVLGFVPQMFTLFLFLSVLEGCGYMARIAFFMDRIFRRFGLSGRSFIPMLLGTGCSVPGIMATRTVESLPQRRMSIITTSFIPCGAKLPVITLVAGAMFGGAWWVAASAYAAGIAAVLLSGIILKTTGIIKSGDTPFIMELPEYRMPSFKVVAQSAWRRGFAFIKKAGSVILLASVAIWALSNIGISGGRIGVTDMENSLLARLGGALAGLFAPLGFGDWRASVAVITGLAAKENIVGTLGVLLNGGDGLYDGLREIFTPLSAMSFLLFNLLCAPCAAAVGAIKKEMASARWTLFAVGYQTAFAWVCSFLLYRLGLVIQNCPVPAVIAAAVTASAAIVLAISLKTAKDRRQQGRAGSAARARS